MPLDWAASTGEQLTAGKDLPRFLEVSMHKAWLVYLNGKAISTMVGAPKTRDQALLAARFHWPQAHVEPR